MSAFLTSKTQHLRCKQYQRFPIAQVISHISSTDLLPYPWLETCAIGKYPYDPPSATEAHSHRTLRWPIAPQNIGRTTQLYTPGQLVQALVGKMNKI